MTQDYEPIEITGRTPEPKEDGTFLVYETEGGMVYEVVVHDSTFDRTHTWYRSGFWSEWRNLFTGGELSDHFKIQSLAAHDAQIRADAWGEGYRTAIDDLNNPDCVSGTPNPYEEHTQ